MILCKYYVLRNQTLNIYIAREKACKYKEKARKCDNRRVAKNCKKTCDLCEGNNMSYGWSMITCLMGKGSITCQMGSVLLYV